MNLTIIDDWQSPVQDRQWIRTSLEWIIHDLRLKKDVTVYVQGIHTEFTNSGKPIAKTATINFEHDGTACDSSTIQVAICNGAEYPSMWDVNPSCGVGYINNIVEAQNAYEDFIYIASHELRHLWQWEQPKMIRKIRALLHCTDETDADIYAIRMLSKYRS